MTDDILIRLRALIQGSYGGDSMETMRDPIATLLAAQDEITSLRHGENGRRWNFHRSGEGAIQVCFGDHERGTSCQYETFVSRSHQDAEALLPRRRLAVALSEWHDAGGPVEDVVLALEALMRRPD